jgi:hypothetical protein
MERAGCKAGFAVSSRIFLPRRAARIKQDRWGSRRRASQRTLQLSSTFRMRLHRNSCNVLAAELGH